MWLSSGSVVFGTTVGSDNRRVVGVRHTTLEFLQHFLQRVGILSHILIFLVRSPGR